MAGTIRIGCSGWDYRHWRGSFYPADLRRQGWLRWYGQRFRTVEINRTFYSLPSREAVQRWLREVPADFRFAVKASRYLTHMKKLKEPEAALERLFEPISALGAALGPVLFQLPPSWKPNVPRLHDFLAALPAATKAAIEIRDPGWYRRDVFDALEDGGAALCLHDMPGAPSPIVRIGPFAYIRLHGAVAKYAGGYPQRDLERWAELVVREADAGRDVYVYFNNDTGGHAPRDASTLEALVLPRSPRVEEPVRKISHNL